MVKLVLGLVLGLKWSRREVIDNVVGQRVVKHGL